MPCLGCTLSSRLMALGAPTKPQNSAPSVVAPIPVPVAIPATEARGTCRQPIEIIFGTTGYRGNIGWSMVCSSGR